MKFMLLQNYGPAASDMGPIHEWSEADIQAASRSRSAK
jgi:hypothetical protein